VTRLALARAGVGLAELTAPGYVGAIALGRPPDGREQAVLRVLGARHLGQYVASRTGHRLLAGPALDALHAASMVGLALVSRRYRRPALTSAAVAAAFSVGALST
jgi:hypothetical protein